MSFYAGLAAGFNQGQGEHNKKLLDFTQQKNSSLSGLYARLAENTDDPELASEFRKRAFSYANVNPFDPKSAKEIKKMGSFEDVIEQQHQRRLQEYQNSLLNPPATGGPPQPQYDIMGRVTPASRMETEAFEERRKAELKSDTEIDLVKRRAAQIKAMYPDLNERDALSIAFGHSLSSTSSLKLQSKPALIKRVDGTEAPGFVNFNPLTGEYVDDNGQPVDARPLVNQHPNSRMDERLVAHQAFAQRKYGDPNHPLTPVEKQAAEVEHIRMKYPMTGGGPTAILNPENPMQGMYVPAPQSFGQVPMATPTMYDLSGVGQTAGMPVTRTAPPPVPEAISSVLAGWELHNQQAAKILTDLKGYKGAMGPAWGNVAKLQLKYLGGWGTTAEEKKMSVELENLLTYKAFAEGGKQLTGPELERFTTMLPKLNDTVELAITKVEKALMYANQVRETKFRMLSPRYQNQLPAPPQIGPLSVPPGPPAGATVPTKGKLSLEGAKEYIKKFGGDVKKAMEAAIADGWDIRK